MTGPKERRVSEVSNVARRFLGRGRRGGQRRLISLMGGGNSIFNINSCLSTPSLQQPNKKMSLSLLRTANDSAVSAVLAGITMLPKTPDLSICHELFCIRAMLCHDPQMHFDSSFPLRLSHIRKKMSSSGPASSCQRGQCPVPSSPLTSSPRRRPSRPRCRPPVGRRSGHCSGPTASGRRATRPRSC